jgi:hypothetical protein
MPVDGMMLMKEILVAKVDFSVDLLSVLDQSTLKTRMISINQLPSQNNNKKRRRALR